MANGNVHGVGNKEVFFPIVNSQDVLALVCCCFFPVHSLWWITLITAIPTSLECGCYGEEER